MPHCAEVNTIMGAVANEAGGAGGGKTYPGAVVPFGMVQLSPDTITGGDNGAGYSYAHPTIEGFSFTHLSGIGWYGELGNIQTMPVAGPRRYYSATNEYAAAHIGSIGWESRYDHETEITRPGYYAVTLTDYDIRVEATAARHCGALRFTFAQAGEGHVMIDLYRRIGGHSDAQHIEVVDDQTLTGRILCTPAGGGWGHGKGNIRYELHFVSRFSRPMRSWAIWDGGAVYEGASAHSGSATGFAADFDVSAGQPIEFHTAISFVDAAGAQHNFECEDCAFDAMRAQAERSWEAALSAIEVGGGTPEAREVFYTSLYHVLLDPRDFSDCDGRYRIDMGAPRRIGDYVFRTVFSGWDVYRSAFPLLTLVRPDVVSDEINSLIEISLANAGAPFPRWELLGIESGCMVGDPGANVLCDAYMKGIASYDVQAAYSICRRWWLGEASGMGELSDYNRLGYFPGDISRTLEYTFTAWCLAQLADALGHADDAAEFRRRAQNYRNIYDSSAGWMNRRTADGAFMPFESKYDERGCVESNIYQQTWFVPHDIDGLCALMGRARFERELDEFFEKADLSAFWNDNYNHSNEPVHTVPHIYVHIGKPHKAQYWVRRIQQEAYRPGPYGYCGNEDVGQMSAWYVLTALGLNQCACASNLFEVNTPLFPSASIALDPKYHRCGRDSALRICTDRDPATHPYISGLALNGVELNRAWLTWEELTDGGTLTYHLSAEPTAFGCDNRPGAQFKNVRP